MTQELERINDNIEIIYDALKKNSKAFDDHITYVNDAFTKIQSKVNDELRIALDRLQVMENRIDALIEQERFDRETIKGIEQEVITLKKFVLGTSRHDIENTLVYQVKQVSKTTTSNTSRIDSLLGRFDDYEKGLRYIVISLALITIVTIANGVSNFIWFFLIR